MSCLLLLFLKDSQSSFGNEMKKKLRTLICHFWSRLLKKTLWRWRNNIRIKTTNVYNRCVFVTVNTHRAVPISLFLNWVICFKAKMSFGARRCCFSLRNMEQDWILRFTCFSLKIPIRIQWYWHWGHVECMLLQVRKKYQIWSNSANVVYEAKSFVHRHGQKLIAFLKSPKEVKRSL